MELGNINLIRKRSSKMKTFKKHGFTLVELLAVIVVLAIILSIAVPAISGIVQKSAKSAFESDAKMLIKAIYYKKMNAASFKETIINENNIYDVLGLPRDNYSMVKVIQSEGITVITIQGKGKWNGLVACGSYNKMKVVSSTSECSADLVPPVITLNGEKIVNVFVGETYSDAGATALDNIDGDLTDRIVVEGTVNPNVPGTYVITHYVIDNSGNEAAVTRTINVIDNVKPTIDFTPNGNSTYAKNREVTINVTDVGIIDNSSLKYVWTTSEVEPTLDEFTSSFTNNQTINTPSDVSGSYYLWVVARDTAGNETISRSDVFSLDNTKPIITLNGDANVTVNKGSTYTDAGATASDEHSGLNGSVTVTGSVNVNVIGTYTITYTVSDKAGNEASPVTRTINVVDVSAPVITILGDNPVTINVGSVYSDAGVTALDDVDGDVTSEIVKTGTVNPNVIGIYTITYTVKDSVGNQAVATRTVNVIDNIVPTVVFGTNGNSAYAKSYNTSVTVSDAHSGINTSSLKYQWTTSTTTPTEASFSTALTNGSTISTPAGVSGSYYLWILAKDNAGNTTIARANVFNLDNTAPIITMNGASPITVNVGTSYSDAGATAIDAHSGLSGSVTATGTVNVNVIGTYKITYTVSDKTGNMATVSRTVNVVDNIKPTVTFGTNGNGTYAKSYSTVVTVSDNIEVNAGSLKYLWNTSTATPSEGSFSTTFTSGEEISSPSKVAGGYYLWILAKDTSGNTTIVRSNVFNIDNLGPTYTSYEIKNKTDDGYEIYVYGVTDNESGVNRVQFPTWTALNGQDDIVKNWNVSSLTAGQNLGGGTYKYTVRRSEHNDEFGVYISHVYLYDGLGNYRMFTTTNVTLVDSTIVAEFYLTAEQEVFDGETSYSKSGEVSNNYTIEFDAYPSDTIDVIAENTTDSSKINNKHRFIIFENHGGGAPNAGLGVSLGTNGITVIAHSSGYYHVLLAYYADLDSMNHYKLVVENRIPRLYINGNLVRTGRSPLSQYTKIYSKFVVGKGFYGNYIGTANNFVFYDVVK
jgi:prepilin-type N-terminal cleavage/methylation domain-containing protein